MLKTLTRLIPVILIAFTFQLIRFNQISIMDWSISNFYFDANTKEISIDVAQNQGSVRRIKCNYHNKHIEINNDIHIDYVNLCKLINLKEIHLNYAAYDFKIKAYIINRYKGNVSIERQSWFSEPLKLAAHRSKGELILTHLPGEAPLLIKPLNYKLPRRADIKCSYNFIEKLLNIEMPNIHIVGNLNEGTNLNCFLNLPIYVGKAKVALYKDYASIDLKLDSGNLFDIIQYFIPALWSEFDGESADSSCIVQLKAKKITISKGKLFNCNGFLEFNNGLLRKSKIQGLTKSGNKVLFRNHSNRPVSINCASPSDIITLFGLENIVKNGEFKGQIDLNRPNLPWSFSMPNTHIIPLGVTILKNIMSPLRALRAIFTSNQKNTQKITGQGSIMNNIIQVKSLTGTNNFYLLTLAGYLDLTNQKVDIKGTLTGNNILSDLQDKLTNQNFLKDTIDIEFIGPFDQVQTKLALSTGNILSYFLQPLAR